MKTFPAVIILFQLSVLTTFASGKARITVRPESEVAGARAVLSDIAVIQPSAGGLGEKLSSVDLCPSPSPGRSRVVTRDDVLIAIRRAGVDDKSVDLLCPPRVSLARSFSRVTGQMLFKAAQDYAQGAAAWTGTVAIEPDPPKQMDFEVPTGKVEFKIGQAVRGIRKGQNRVPVEILVEGRTYMTVRVGLRIKVVAPVLVATHTISRSAEVNASNAAVVQRDVTNLPDDVVAEQPLPGQSAKFTIAEGAVIRSSWIVAPSVVHSGDTVAVIVRSGLVQVTAKGTASQDGRVGETIKVRLTRDSQEVRGEVSGPDTVVLGSNGGDQR